ncbi:HET-domain-containing protein [Aspergillus alliaceus]|uniref:HET-domain-containing protein n=1 Tax=Petromyces alliaceus TaxID=209559 RepID=A0A5N7CLY7_PETAA|nr:HET-domain-containing protein [Aspergillus alliaceus]
MRLLNARTFQLVEFVGNPPPYAILSHTWSTQEVSFQAILSGGAYYMRGFWKIHGCCEKALEDNLEYVWVDTCCIDKSSPAELSEAINSMFEWYKNAHVCYVYLEDVDVEFPRWYTRGWTLQELLAPSNVVFYNTRWDRIGTKRQLLREISDITKIDEMNLIEFGIRPTSVGQKMSWAANRTTTRPEDMAYCLLGLFGVHLPLLYGEGRNAFRRLQEEIIKCSTDMSIFIWKDGDTRLVAQGNWGVLATSPGCFTTPFV